LLYSNYVVIDKLASFKRLELIDGRQTMLTRSPSLQKTFADEVKSAVRLKLALCLCLVFCVGFMTPTKLMNHLHFKKL